MRNNELYSLGERTPAPLPRDPLVRDALLFFTEGESMTRQSEKASADVNAIVERFARTGQLPPARFEGSYADVTGLQGDLTELYNRSQDTQAAYAEALERANAQPEPAPEPAPESAPAPATPAAE